MKYGFVVENEFELKAYQTFLKKHEAKIADFISFLEAQYDLVDYPKHIVWSNVDMATNVLRDTPIPAYTNDSRMVMTPELKVWKRIYLAQLDVYEDCPDVTEIRDYYERKLNDNHLLQIIGHELTHSSDLFLDDDAYEKGIWFEEGMVEYISRSYFLTKDLFEAEKLINQKLVALFEERFGQVSLESFGQSTYEENMASIFVHYWKSVLKIDELVSRLGSVNAVLSSYHEWDKAGQKVSLCDWFESV